MKYAKKSEKEVLMIKLPSYSILELNEYSNMLLNSNDKIKGNYSKIEILGEIYKLNYSVFARAHEQYKIVQESDLYSNQFKFLVKILTNTDVLDCILKSDIIKQRKIIYIFDSYLKKYDIRFKKIKNKKSKDVSEEENETNEFKVLKRIFDYDTFRKNLEINNFISEKLELKTCIYCNAQSTLTVKKTNKETKTLFQLDHFYPKSLYPYLALSIYNLIPSCANCNLSKSNIDTYKDRLIHPYEDSFNDYMKYTSCLDLDSFMNGKINANAIKVDIKSQKNDDIVENHNKIFYLQGIAEEHRDLIAEIYTKSYIYNDTRRKELVKLFGDNLKNKYRFIDEDVIKRVIFGNYTEIEDLNKRPLAKLTRDISEELGLL